MNLIQLSGPSGRAVALVQDEDLIVLEGFKSTYELASHAISDQISIANLVRDSLSLKRIAYKEVYEGTSTWRILPALDHPTDPNRCMLAGTGLTHKASAENRQKMHESQEEDQLTDSMKMYLWGVEGGHTKPNKIGTQPEWFYKGNGSMLKGHGDGLSIPAYADDGGEEPEVAGIYINDKSGTPWRVGFATANEFSDHIMERKNYLYLAPSKIRECAIGPELVIDEVFDSLTGTVSIFRKGKEIWKKEIKTGERNMAHSLSNLEYHHFKYGNHRIPGQVHIHFFGADAFSFGEGIRLEDEDMMQVHWNGMGRPLQNRVNFSKDKEKIIPIHSIHSI